MRFYNTCRTNADPLGYRNLDDVEGLVPGIFSDDEQVEPLLCQELGLPADAISVIKPGLDFKCLRLDEEDLEVGDSY